VPLGGCWGVLWCGGWDFSVAPYTPMTLQAGMIFVFFFFFCVNQLEVVAPFLVFSPVPPKSVTPLHSALSPGRISSFGLLSFPLTPCATLNLVFYCLIIPPSLFDPVLCAILAGKGLQPFPPHVQSGPPDFLPSGPPPFSSCAQTLER